MVSRNGYVLLHRAVLRSDIGRNPVRLAAFCQMLGAANHDARTIQWNGEPRVCERGSFVLSLKGFAEQIGMHRVTFKKHLEYMVKRHTVKLEKAREGCLITFVNYEQYQDVTLSLLKAGSKIDTAIDTSIDTTIDTGIDTGMAPNKENKELKKTKKGSVSVLPNEQKESFGTFWAAWSQVAPKVGRGRAEKAFAKCLKTYSFADVLTALEKLKAYKDRTREAYPHPTTFLNNLSDYLEPDYGQSDKAKTQTRQRMMSV